MNLDFELILTLAVIISGIIWLLDAKFWAPARNQRGITKPPVIIEYAVSFFPVLLIVLLLRSFFAEPFRIPSGSDKPTLLVGDFIVANKFAYGVRLPVLHTKILKVNEPKTADIALLRYPVDPSVDFIKRVVGMPGDTVSYINKVLYINGKEMPQTVIGEGTDIDEAGRTWPVIIAEENLSGIKHKIFLRPDAPAIDKSWVVPAGEYFVMGDNRDDSNDSRFWGFVPEENLVGKAYAIWFSWNGDDHNVRWTRIGQLIR